jgi:hypothetical protein
MGSGTGSCVTSSTANTSGDGTDTGAGVSTGGGGIIIGSCVGSGVGATVAVAAATGIAAAAATPVGVPQARQNLAPGASGAPQLHGGAPAAGFRPVPHALQNFAVAVLMAWQFSHVVI